MEKVRFKWQVSLYRLPDSVRSIRQIASQISIKRKEREQLNDWQTTIHTDIQREREGERDKQTHISIDTFRPTDAQKCNTRVRTAAVEIEDWHTIIKKQTSRHTQTGRYTHTDRVIHRVWVGDDIVSGHLYDWSAHHAWATDDDAFANCPVYSFLPMEAVRSPM